MTLRELRSDILLILSHSKVSKDKRFWEGHIDFLIHKYRARAIRETFQRQGYIDPMWMQDLGVRKTTIVNSAEEREVACGNLALAKLTLPPILSLPDDNGVVRISSTSVQKTFYRIDVERFFDIDPSSIRAKFDYYIRVASSFYFPSLPEEVRPILLLDNPMDGDFFDNTIQYQISPTLEYNVVDGVVTYNGTTYQPGQGFIGVVDIATWTGPGKVFYKEFRRRLSEDDQYPMTFQIADYISMMILTKDFAIEAKAVADIKNDNADQLTLMQQN